MQVLIILLRALSLLPLWALYGLSSLTAWVLEHLVRYRKEVIDTNLRNAFPQLDDRQRKAIRHRYYTYLADVMVETLKLPRLSGPALLKRVHYDQPELLNELASQQRRIVLMMGHSGNWEWAGAATAYRSNFPILPVYRAVKNKSFDRYFKQLRSRFGATPVLDKEAMQVASGTKPPYVMPLLADQTPSAQKGIWMRFLHQDTPFYRGAEILTKRYDHAVVLAHVYRERRGHYRIHFEHANAGDTRRFGITQQFAEFLEEKVKEQPYNWLWSHKRWKHQPQPHAQWVQDAASARSSQPQSAQ